MTSTLPRGTLVSVASLLAETLYQGNLDKNHKLWYIISTERYIIHMQVQLECCYIYINGKWENLNNSFVVKFRSEPPLTVHFEV